jgi:Kef-type K+ transport system membrane component KefB
MLMFNAGLNVPVRDGRVRAALPGGIGRAFVVAVLAVGAGVLVRIHGVSHPGVYAVILASGSAAVVLPIVQERRLAGQEVLSVIAQVTVADIAATVAIPFVLRPSKAGEAVAGSLLVAGCLIAIYIVGRWLRRFDAVRSFRKRGKRRRWAIDLRLALIILFGLAWLARRTGASLLIAGFGSGLVVALGLGERVLTSAQAAAIIAAALISLGACALGAAVLGRDAEEARSGVSLSPQTAT